MGRTKGSKKGPSSRPSAQAKPSKYTPKAGNSKARKGVKSLESASSSSSSPSSFAASAPQFLRKGGALLRGKGNFTTKLQHDTKTFTAIEKVDDSSSKMSKTAKRKMAKELSNQIDNLGLLMAGNSSSASTEKVHQARARAQLVAQVLKKKKKSKGSMRKKSRHQKAIDGGEDFQDRLQAKLDKRRAKEAQRVTAYS